jgi:transposase
MLPRSPRRVRQSVRATGTFARSMACQRVVSGNIPARIILKGVTEPSLIAQQVISKRCDHMPLYRQQPVLVRSDIHLPVPTRPDPVGRVGTVYATGRINAPDAADTQCVAYR